MKRIVVAGIFVCSLTTAAAFAADVKLGYFDMQRVLSTSVAGKEAKEQLAARVKKYQDEINVKQEEIKKLKDQLETQGMLLSESSRSSKEKDYQQRLKEYQRFTKDAQEDMQARDRELSRSVAESAEKIVRDFGRNNGYTFIFVKNDAILFSDDKTDVTDEVLKIFDAARKK